jgi:phage-related protein
MADQSKRLPALFFRSTTGREPVRDWLLSLDKPARRVIGTDIKTVEYGWPVGMPVCKSLGQGIWEVRSHLTRNRMARVLFCFHRGNMVLLHGFIKKSRKLPKADFALALERQSQLQEENE